jgi:hypothetical protein
VSIVPEQDFAGEITLWDRNLGVMTVPTSSSQCNLRDWTGRPRPPAKVVGGRRKRGFRLSSSVWHAHFRAQDLPVAKGHNVEHVLRVPHEFAAGEEAIVFVLGLIAIDSDAPLVTAPPSIR